MNTEDFLILLQQRGVPEEFLKKLNDDKVNAWYVLYAVCVNSFDPIALFTFPHLFQLTWSKTPCELLPSLGTSRRHGNLFKKSPPLKLPGQYQHQLSLGYLVSKFYMT